MSDSVRPHRRQPTRLPCPWDSPGKNTGVGCHFLLQCMKVKVKSLSRVWLLATPWTAAYQAPQSMGFSRQEYWSGVPLPSPISSYSYNYLLGYTECWTYVIVDINFSLSFMFVTKVVFWILWPNSYCLSLIWELSSWIDTSVYEIFLSLPIFDQHPRSVLIWDLLFCFLLPNWWDSWFVGTNFCFPEDKS